MKNSLRKFIVFLAIIAVIYGVYFALRPKKTIAPQKEPVEKPAEAQEETGQVADINVGSDSQKSAENPKTATDEKPASEIPEKFLLDIPFYSQAPLSQWDAFHEDMCEEASVLNGALFLEGRKISKEQFEAELQSFKKLEEKELGVWKSTTIAQLKSATDKYFEGKIKSKIIENPTIEDIEREIAAGNPVIAPLAGRDIGNPNFTPPGPVYHMLAIKGYDAKNFITNDVGTRKGNSYTYSKDVIMKNMHDWNEKDIHLGNRRILVLYKS